MGGYAQHVCSRVGGGHPSPGLGFRAVLRDRLTEESLLVLRGTPTAVDREVDSVACGIGCSPAQGAEESSIEVGHTRNRLIEDRRAVGDGTVGLAERTTMLTANHIDGWCGRTTVLTAKEVCG